MHVVTSSILICLQPGRFLAVPVSLSLFNSISPGCVSFFVVKQRLRLVCTVFVLSLFDWLVIRVAFQLPCFLFLVFDSHPVVFCFTFLLFLPSHNFSLSKKETFDKQNLKNDHFWSFFVVSWCVFLCKNHRRRHPKIAQQKQYIPAGSETINGTINAFLQ